MVDLFRKEAEQLTEGEPNHPSPLDAATEMFLSLGYLMQGRDGMILKHLSNASSIGVQLGLFGVPDDIAQAAFDRMTPEELRAAAYPAWGVFNWTVYDVAKTIPSISWREANRRPQPHASLLSTGGWSLPQASTHNSRPRG